MARPTVEPHYGLVRNSKSFIDAFQAVQENPSKTYSTNSGKEFTAVARMTTKGVKKGEKVIIFYRQGRESARSYSCCWGHQTNCYKTYIDPYSHKI